MAEIDTSSIESPRNPKIRPLLPPKDGVSRLHITSAIANGDSAPTIYFAGTIEPNSVRAMVLSPGPMRNHNLTMIARQLMQKLDRFCEIALAAPGAKQ